MMRIYLSIPIQWCSSGWEIDATLTEAGYIVLNPCRIVPSSVPKSELPGYIASECYSMIDRSDALVLFANYYGRDCASEVGYAIAKHKPVFPLLIRTIPGNGENLQVDWMLKFGMEDVSLGYEDLLNKLKLFAKSKQIPVSLYQGSLSRQTL